MGLAPQFHDLDVFLVDKHIYNSLAGLITEPAAHPSRKVTGHCRTLLDIGRM
jgi:hypothetical protein